MQGLVNFATAIGDGIAVLLPAFCYLAACGCFFFFAWTLWTWSQPHRHHHHHWHRPWVPWVSLILSGVFASFPQFLTTATVVNVVTLFQHFFQAFGAACVFWAIMTWRAIVNGRINGSPTACGVQFVFGVLCINIVTVANGVVSFFQTGG